MGIRTLIARLGGQGTAPHPTLLHLRDEEARRLGALALLESRLACATAEVSALQRAAASLRPGLPEPEAREALLASGALAEAEGAEDPKGLRTLLDDLAAQAARTGVEP